MIEAAAEITLEGPDRKHDVRFDTRINLQPPAVIIVQGWVQRPRADEQVAERRIPPPLLDRMRADAGLAKWLFENTIADFPQ